MEKELREGHIEGFREELAGIESSDDFFRWFNHAEDAHQATVQGSWDFSIQIAAKLWPYVDAPEKKTLLEIGYGGGRILAAACRHFDQVVGVDIHTKSKLVATQLRSEGLENFTLHETDGMTFPIDDASIDAAFSFIVFQHMEKIDVLKRNISELRRVMKDGGHAVVYFGRTRLFTKKRPSRFFYTLDKLAEKAYHPKGYKEKLAQVNFTNLVLTLGHGKSLFRSNGFEILETFCSQKRESGSSALHPGGQHGLLLKAV